MAISLLTAVTYPNFQLLQIIDPDKFDVNFQDCVDKIDETITEFNKLKSITNDASGADNVYMTAISPFASTTIQSFLETLLARMVATTDSASGADYIGSTAIAGITGTTVQAQLESTKDYIDTHKGSTDHDSRYYTETELNAGQLNNQYYTETELNAGQLNNLYYTETELNAGQLNNIYYTETELNNGQLDTRYYTKTNMQTSLGASVHWDNLTNKPAMADASWKPPVANLAALPTESNTNGDLRIVLDIDTVYTWDVDHWETIGATGNGITEHGTLTGLSDDDHTQYLRTDGTRALTGNVDFAKYQAQNLVAHNSATSPVSPADGQLWFDTTTNKLNIYRGAVAGWSSVIDGSAVIKDKEIVATASQTVFSILDTGTYEIGKNLMSVYKKNASGRYDLLDESDYTETSTTVITLGTGASVGETFYFKWFENNPNTVSDLSAYVTTATQTASTSTSTVTSLSASTIKGELSDTINGNTTNGYDANTKLLLFFGGADASTTFTDQTGKTVTPSGNAQIDTAQSKYGGSSGLFDGTGDYLTVTNANNDLDFGTGDFTIEFWVRPSDVSGAYNVIDFKQSATTDISPNVIISATKIYYRVGSTARITGTTVLTANLWYHVAISRSSGVTKMYLNGIQEGSSYTDANDYIAVATITIGCSYSNGGTFNGWFDELRISNTARYTATFEPNTLNFQHTNMTRIKSVGKNLFDGKFEIGDIQSDGTLAVNATRMRTNNFIKIKPSTAYILSNDLTYSPVIFEYDINLNFLRYVTIATITTSSNAGYLKFRFATNQIDLNVKAQLELGSTATTYEPYTETSAIIPVTLRSVSSTIKDTFDANVGKHTKNVSDVVTLSGNAGTWAQSAAGDAYTGYQRIFSNNIITNAAIGATELTQCRTLKYNNKSLSCVYLVDAIDTAYLSEVANRIYVNIADADTGFDESWVSTTTFTGMTWPNLIKCYMNGWKLTTANVNVASCVWTGISSGTVKNAGAADYAFCYANIDAGFQPYRMIYQLSTPVVTNYWSNVLTAEPSGTIIAEPYIGDVGLYATNITIADSTYPISSLTHVNKINLTTGSLTPIALSACTVAAGGLTFTISGASAGEYYDYGYTYTGLSTNVSQSYSYCTNLKAQVNGNTEQIKDLDVKIETLRDNTEANLITNASTASTALTTHAGLTTLHTNVLTTEGDTLYRNATVPARLAKGTAGQVLKMNSGATAPEWGITSKLVTFADTSTTIGAGAEVVKTIELGFSATHAIVYLSNDIGTYHMGMSASVGLGTGDTKALAVNLGTTGPTYKAEGLAGTLGNTYGVARFATTDVNVYVKYIGIYGTELRITFYNAEGTTKTISVNGNIHAFA